MKGERRRGQLLGRGSKGISPLGRRTKSEKGRQGAKRPLEGGSEPPPSQAGDGRDRTRPSIRRPFLNGFPGARSVAEPGPIKEAKPTVWTGPAGCPRMSRVDVRKIPFDRIDLGDERFRISYDFPRERLRASLERAGLVQPLHLVERTGRLVLLSGWKRILVLEEMGIREGPVAVVDEADDLPAFRRTFYENASFRDFSIVEIAMAVRRLLELGEEEDTVLSAVLPFFRLPPAKSTLETLRILSADDPETRRLLQESGVSPSAAVLLGGMSAAARRRVARILAPLGRNKQVELLENLVDLSARDGCSAEEVLDSERIRDLFDEDMPDRLRRSEMIRTRLDRIKNPRVWAWRNAFARSVRKLRLPTKASIRADPAYESEELTLTLSFRSAAEFRAAIRELETISRGKDIKDLFEDPEGRPG